MSTEHTPTVAPVQCVVIWQHDCDVCRSLGPYQDGETKYDLYWCPSGGGGRPTVVARYSDEGPGYTSGIEIANSGLSPCLVEAKRRAEIAGLDVSR